MLIALFGAAGIASASRRSGMRVLAAVTLMAPGAAAGSAQNRPPAPVEFTSAQSYELGANLQLPGSVESLRKSQVASPVEGLVTELLVREGETVEQGQVLARLDTATWEARRTTLQADLLEAESRLRAADHRLKRAQDLFEAEVISDEQLDDSRFEREALDARTVSLRASIEEVELEIKQSVILAPFRGAVTEKLSEVGQWVQSGDPLVVLLALEELEVNVDVPEIHIGKVRLGQAAQITLDAFPASPLRGKVSAMVPEADPDSRTFPVKVAVASQNGSVRVGMMASVSLAPSRPRRTTVVPKDALVSQGAGWVVFTIQAGDTVSAVPVRPGEGVGEWIEVRGSVEPGDRIVTEGNERLRPGQKVQPQRGRYEAP